METIDVLVGRIGKAHGLRGDLTINVRTDEPERRFAPGSVLVVEAPQGSATTLKRLTVASHRWHSGVLLVRFEEVPDRTAAEGARGILLYATVPSGASPEDPDEYYDHQLVGLTAYDLDGATLGEVTGLVHGAQDLLEIKATDGRNTLVPFVKQLVPEVDVPGGRIVVADRPGLVTPLEDE